MGLKLLSSPENLHDALVELIEEHDVSVIPCSIESKKPFVPWARWQNKTPTADHIESWIHEYPGCLWGAITGRSFGVVDVDSYKDESILVWARENLPYTPLKARTKSGGEHWIYSHLPDSETISQNDGIDIRNVGGYAICAGPGYEWIWESDSDFHTFRELPELSSKHISLIKRRHWGDNVASLHNWHETVRNRVWALLGEGWTDVEILAKCGEWTQSGWTDEQTRRDVQKMLQGRRAGEKRHEGADKLLERVEEPRQGLVANPFDLGDVLKIPPREFVYGNHLIRKFISVTTAPGGIGKTALTLVEAIAMASGKPLLGVEVGEPQRVWVWNLEDPFEEIWRRIAGICQRYSLTQDDLAGRLFVNSGRDQALVIAVQTKDGVQFTPHAMDLTTEIVRHGIDAVIVDPFVSSHRLAENDNDAMDALAKMWAQIANDGNCAIDLVHHTRKATGTGPQTTEDARGASSVMNAARHGRLLKKMTGDEARNAGIEGDEAWRYSKEGNSKENLTPPSSVATWYKLESESIPNGDNIGVQTPWGWPDPFEGLSTSHLRLVQTAVASGEWRDSPKSKEWVGVAVAEALDIDIEDAGERAKIRMLLKTWIKNGMLAVVEALDDNRNPRKFVRVKQWAGDL